MELAGKEPWVPGNFDRFDQFSIQRCTADLESFGHQTVEVGVVELETVAMTLDDLGGPHRIEAIVGRGRKDWLHLMDTLRAEAKAMGCGLIGCNARPGWRNEIPHMRHSTNLLEAPL